MSSPNKSLMVWGILPTPLQPRGEDPETVEMGDVEIVHPGSVGDELLREVIETWVGWVKGCFNTPNWNTARATFTKSLKRGCFS